MSVAQRSLLTADTNQRHVWLMTWHHRYSAFNAAEVAAITGLDQKLQREWRRRGHLPAVASPRAKAVFDSKELAQVYALVSLARFGIGPAIGNQLAASCAVLILSYALKEMGAVSDPERLNLAGEPIIKQGPGPLPRYVVTSDGQSWGWTDDPREQMTGPGPLAIVFDLQAAGEHLASCARKPLVTIVAGEA